MEAIFYSRYNKKYKISFSNLCQKSAGKNLYGLIKSKLEERYTFSTIIYFLLPTSEITIYAIFNKKKADY